MGAVEHLKTLCCLGLPPESAMIAVMPLLHEIIPHGWTRAGLIEPDATITSTHAENPEAPTLCRERLWTFMDDPSSLASLLSGPAFRAVGIGWALHMQGRGWLENGFFREIEAPLDSCWILDAMIGRCRPDFWICSPHASTQRPPLYGGRRAAPRPPASMARARIPAVSVRRSAQRG
jgi:hypothetical protein